MAIMTPLQDHRRVHATIALLDDSSRDLASLYTWLQRDDELRGRVESRSAELRPGDMGGVAEMLTVALGSGGVVAALGGVLSAWLPGRRTRISIEITNGDRTRRVEIDSVNASTAARLLKEACEAADEQS